MNAPAPRPPETIDGILERLGQSRAALLATVDTFDDARFVQVPGEGGWSAAQVLEHLARVEQIVTMQARRTLAGKEAPEESVGEMRRAYLALDRSRKIRTQPPFDPQETLPRAALFMRLAETRAVFAAFLVSLRARDLSAFRMRHPSLGVMPLIEMLAFIPYHEERHRMQLEEIAGALG